MAGYAGIINAARKGENQKNGKPENNQNVLMENQQTSKPEEVNLSVKVAKNRRQHWAAEAKRQGTSLTAVITEALSARFGEPKG